MRDHFHRNSLMHLKHSILYTSIAIATAMPGVSFAQATAADDEAEVEEVVVTGTYIRNSAFAGASPVDTIDQDALLSTGSISTG